MAEAALDLGNMTLEQAQRLHKALIDYRDFIRDGKIYYFNPHPKQQLFFHPDRDEFPRFRVFLGGNRTGKTECGVLEAFAFAMGERPWDGTKTPVPVPNRGRICATSYLDGLKKVIEPKIRMLWPKTAIKNIKKGQVGNIAEITLSNGSVIDFLSYDQESLKHEGADLDWVLFDEPPTREHFIANVRGLVDRGGYCWLTLTPLKEAWILDEIVNKAKAGDPNYFYVQASMYDNISFGLHQKSVKEFEAQLTEEERAVRIHGEFLALQGLVYKEWKDHYWVPNAESKEEAGGHIVKPFTIPAHWPRIMSMDPHDRTPSHVIWIAINEKSEAVIYDELLIPPIDAKRMAATIKERESHHREVTNRSIVRFIDPAAARRANTLEVGANLRDELMKNGLYCYPAMNDIDAGHKAVREYLEITETSRGWKPKLFVFDTCTGVRRAMNRYLWDDWASPKEAQKKDAKNKPREKDKHFPDTIRYALNTFPQYYEPRKKGKGGLPINSEVTGY